MNAVKAGHRGWIQFSVDIDDLFSQTFGADGYYLEGVEGIELAGKVEIATINMYRRVTQNCAPPRPTALAEASRTADNRRRFVSVVGCEDACISLTGTTICLIIGASMLYDGRLNVRRGVTEQGIQQAMVGVMMIVLTIIFSWP